MSYLSVCGAVRFSVLVVSFIGGLRTQREHLAPIACSLEPQGIAQCRSYGCSLVIRPTPTNNKEIVVVVVDIPVMVLDTMGDV